MLDTDTKRRIDDARDILVGKVPAPKSQVEQISIALIYKFLYDMGAESEELDGNAGSTRVCVTHTQAEVSIPAPAAAALRRSCTDAGMALSRASIQA